MLRYILPGSIIISKDKVDYDYINKIQDGIYEYHEYWEDHTFSTQLALQLWIAARKKLNKLCGTPGAHFSTYLNEFIWRHTSRHEIRTIGRFFSVLINQYPL